MEESLPKMVDTRVKELTKTQVPIYVAQGIIMERQQSQADVENMIADAIQQECKNLRVEISSQINNPITNHIPSQVDSSVRNYMSGNILHLQQDNLPIWLALKYKFERLHVSNTHSRPSIVHPRDQDDPHDDAHPEGENSAKRQKTFEHGTYVFGESSSRQVNESKPRPSTSVQSCQRDPKAPTLSLVNQDLLYLKKGNSGSEKIVMSLHKFLVVIFPDDDIEKELPDG
ncbi:hypothetical protein Tco_1416275 [Tanacetum coccineum]